MPQFIACYRHRARKVCSIILLYLHIAFRFFILYSHFHTPAPGNTVYDPRMCRYLCKTQNRFMCVQLVCINSTGKRPTFFFTQHYVLKLCTCSTSASIPWPLTAAQWFTSIHLTVLNYPLLLSDTQVDSISPGHEQEALGI